MTVGRTIDVQVTCTGVTATWCPRCGDCTCDRHADGEVDFDVLGTCPLHSCGSDHACGDEGDRS